MTYPLIVNKSYLNRLSINRIDTLYDTAWDISANLDILYEICLVARYTLMYMYLYLYLVNGCWVFCKHRIILKGLSNKNNPPKEFVVLIYA
jgi:hypothetical protein